MTNWTIKFSSLVALNLVSFMLPVLALYFQVSVREYKHVSNIAGMNLLLVCLLQSLTTMPLLCLRMLGYNQGVRDSFLFLYFLFQNATTFSLLLLSIDRVASLWKPLLYPAIMSRQNVTRALILCWILCVCFDIIPFVNGRNTYFGHYLPGRYWNVAYHFLTNIVPFLVLLLCWMYIVRVTVRQNNKYQVSKARLIKLKAIKLTVTILTSYLLLYGPACFYYSLKAVCWETCFPSNYHGNRIDSELRFAFKFIALLFNLVNPVLMCWTKKFAVFARSFKVGRTRRRNDERHVRSLYKTTGVVRVNNNTASPK